MPAQNKIDMVEDDFNEYLQQPEIYHFSLTQENQGERLDKAIARFLPQFSRNRIQRWIDAGFVTVDGKQLPGKRTVLGDEKITVISQLSEEETAYLPEQIDIPIVYEDSDIIIINKPAGLVTHPAAGNWSGTLLNGLLHYYPPIATVPRAGIVHRLDKDTSGLMVVAKTLQAQTHLIRQLQERSVYRQYLALVWGIPSSKGVINIPIGRHPRDRIKMSVIKSGPAKPAITHYEKIATGKLDKIDVRLLICQLETGRTHQIRVHLQSLGFPLVGDPLYGKSHLSHIFNRQALHAKKLGLMHPTTEKSCEWQANIPDDFSALLDKVGIKLYE